jgi:hypothetical protein
VNVHCGKHDKIYDSEKGKCPGCSYREENANLKESAPKKDSTILGPDDTLAQLRGVSEKHKNVWTQMVEKITGRKD